MGWTAAELYGTAPSAQPNPAAPMATAPGTPAAAGARTQRTDARPNVGLAGSPAIVLVALLGAAVLLTQLSVRGSVSIG